MTSPLSTVERVVDPVSVTALAQLLGAEDVDTEPGAPLPPLWHWVALARWPDPASLGPDGHPRRGTGGMPDVALPRRMFGGGRVGLHRALPIGATVTVATSASSPRSREGRTGPLVLVDLTVEVRDQQHRLLLEETQHLVYTVARTVTGEPPTPQPVEQVPRLLTPRPADPGWSVRTDPGLLARYSALSANPHRIHVDWPYATGVEGYPALVVHGPLQATVLAEVSRRAGHLGAEGPRVVEHRGLAPLFCGEPAVAVPDEEHRAVELRTGPDGEAARVHARLLLDPR